jgi:hypothetical protein
VTLLYQHDLRVRLSERRSRLYKAAAGPVFDNELSLFLAWLSGQPYIAALLTEIESESISLEEYEKGGKLEKRMFRFPDDEAQRAKLCLEICRAGDLRKWPWIVSSSQNFSEMYADYVEVIVDPLVNYLHDRLEGGGSVLGILERYKRRTEWFHQADLHERYTNDTARGEAILDRHLREYLVDQGIAYPFSQPSSPSGEADVVADLGGDDPLSLEVKLFLPSARKDDAYVRQGFAQAVRYANDYMLPVGYLAVFNLTEELLVFKGAGEERWPPVARAGDTTVFLIAIQANPNRPAASRDRHLARHVIDNDFLLAGRG